MADRTCDESCGWRHRAGHLHPGLAAGCRAPAQSQQGSFWQTSGLLTIYLKLLPLSSAPGGQEGDVSRNLIYSAGLSFTSAPGAAQMHQ